MSGSIIRHNLFKPKPSKAETKADITDHTARAITGAEVERREAKTARLRQARLEAEAKLADRAAPAGKPHGMQPAVPRRARSST